MDKTHDLVAAVDDADGLSGVTPTVAAAAVVYMAAQRADAGVDVSQDTVAEIAGCTDVALRQRYKAFADRLNVTVDRDRATPTQVRNELE